MHHYYLIHVNGTVETHACIGFPYRRLSNYYDRWLSYKHHLFTKEFLGNRDTILLCTIENLPTHIKICNAKASAMLASPVYGIAVLVFLDNGIPSKVPLHLWTWLFVKHPKDYLLSVLKARQIAKPLIQIRKRIQKQSELRECSIPLCDSGKNDLNDLQYCRE